MLPKRFPDREAIAAVRGAAERAEPGQTLDEEHRVAGRVMARREMGKLTFLDLVDRSGRIQLISEQKVELDLGDVVGVTGRPGRSRRGEPSLTVTELQLLAKIRRPLPDTFHGVTDVETRYRQRYLDLLMSEDSRRLAATRTRMIQEIRAYLDGEGFIEVEALVERAALGSIGTRHVTFRGHKVDLAPPWQRVKFVEALEERGVWSRDEGELRAKLAEAGVATERDRSWAQLADHAYSHFVEPELIQPTIVYDWPIELSPFARTTDDDETIVERFECVVCGMEFANAFSELNDAEEQAQRFTMQEAEREAGAEESEPGDPDFVEALSYGMPP